MINTETMTLFHDGLRNLISQQFAIISAPRFATFRAVTQITAFHQYRGINCLAHHPIIGGMHTAINGAFDRAKPIMDVLRQLRCIGLTIVGLKSFHSALSRIIEMNADENRVWRAVFNIDARVEWNKNIVRSRHHHVELGCAQFLAEPRGDIESDGLFRRTVSTVGAAVASAVAGIDDDGSEGAAGVL